jgi:hypothetical protein
MYIRRVNMRARHQYFLKAIVLFLVSPVYVPAVILWHNKKDILDFYKEFWQAVTFTHPEYDGME